MRPRLGLRWPGGLTDTCGTVCRRGGRLLQEQVCELAKREKPARERGGKVCVCAMDQSSRRVGRNQSVPGEEAAASQDPYKPVILRLVPIIDLWTAIIFPSGQQHA